MQAYEVLRGLLKLDAPAFANLTDASRSQWLVEKELKLPGSIQYTFMVKNGSAVQNMLHEALPNVPLDRLKQPFVRAIRHDTLLTPEEMMRLAKQRGLEPKFADWLHKEEWRDLLPRGEAKWAGQDSTVLFLNTGAHLSRICFGLAERQAVADMAEAVVSPSGGFRQCHRV